MQESKEKACEICGITNKETNRVSYCSKADKILCSKHLAQYLRNGFFLDYTIFDRNSFMIYEDRAEVELRGKYGDIVGYAIVDIEDVDKLRKYKWYLRKDGYAITKIKGKGILMHRLILGYSSDLDIDHVNRNRLDNRKSNLRIVSRSENCVNTEVKSNTGYKNITKTPYNTYEVRIKRDGSKIYQKRYNSLTEAIAARDKVISDYNALHNRAC